MPRFWLVESVLQIILMSAVNQSCQDQSDGSDRKTWTASDATKHITHYNCIIRTEHKYPWHTIPAQI